MPAKKGFGLGWSLVLHSALMYFFTAGIAADGMNVIIPSFEAARGFTRGAMNIAAAGAGWASVIGFLLFAILVMKFGPRIISTIALILCGIATAYLGRTSTMTGFTICLVSMVFLTAGFGWTTTNTLISNWFVKKRGIAFGLATMGLPLATAVFVPLANKLVQIYGISGGFTVIGVVIAITGPITYIWVKDIPEAVGQAPDGADMTPEEIAEMRKMMIDHHSAWTIGKLLKNKEAWFISLGYGILFLVTVGIVSQLVPRMMDMGYTVNQAILFLSSAAIIGIAGSYLWGWLDQKLSVRIASIIYCVWYAVAIILLLVDGGKAMTILAVFFIGVALGGIGNLYPSMVAYTYGRHEFVSVNRVINTIVPIIRPLGFAVVGVAFAKTGSYNAGYIVLFILAIVSLILISRVKRNFNPEI